MESDLLTLSSIFSQAGIANEVISEPSPQIIVGNGQTKAIYYFNSRGDLLSLKFVNIEHSSFATRIRGNND